jgi:hypothetical protein
MAARFPDTQTSGFSTGRVFSRAFGTITANPLAAIGIAFLFSALPSEVYQYASAWLFPAGGLGFAQAFALMASGSIFAALANGSFVRLVVAYDGGRRPSFREALQASMRSLLPLIALSLIIGIGTMIGFILLVVPGVILSLMWAVAAAVLVDQQCGAFAALGRSRTLTEGAWSAIFGIGILVGVAVVALVYFTLSLAGNFYGDAGTSVDLARPSILYMSVELLITAIATAVSAAVYTSIYVELRNWKDGTPEDALVEIFA